MTTRAVADRAAVRPRGAPGDSATWWWAGVPLAGLATALVLTVRFGGFRGEPVVLGVRYAVCWGLFGVALIALRRVPARHVGALVLLGGVAIALTGLAAPPTTSTDSFRYAWDGRVQAAGISPYDHTPADPALAPLRDRWLFPAGPGCSGPDRAAVPPAGTCTRINRPWAHTIYPPVAEAYFLLIHEVSPAGARHKPLQIGGAILSVGVTVLLLALLRRRGLEHRLAALWAWCPAVPLEAVNNAHVDVLAVLLTVAALAAFVRNGPVAGGMLLGSAIAAKLLPAIALPALCAGLFAGPGRLRAAAQVAAPALAVTGLSYVPYLLVSRSSVLGYLWGYTREEGYDTPGTGGRYALLRVFVPGSWTLPIIVLVMAAVVVHVLRRGDPRRPWIAATTLTGTAFLLLTPGYPWYALLLVALAALAGRPEWLTVAAAGQAVYLLGQVTPAPVAVSLPYGLAAAIVVTAAVIRSRRRQRQGHRLPLPHQDSP